MSNAFTKLALSIAARKAGKVLGMAGLGSGIAAGLSHGLDASSMGLADAITYGKSYYSPLLKALGADNMAKVNDELAEKLFKVRHQALENANPGKIVIDFDTPGLKGLEHRGLVAKGGLLSGLAGLTSRSASGSARKAAR